MSGGATELEPEGRAALRDQEAAAVAAGITASADQGSAGRNLANIGAVGRGERQHGPDGDPGAAAAAMHLVSERQNRPTGAPNPFVQAASNAGV